MSGLPRIVLKRGKEKPLLRGHPWVFSGAVSKVHADIAPGDLAEVYSAEGQFLGVGHANPRSQIVFRLLSRESGRVEMDFYRKRITSAALWREAVLKGTTDAYRIVNGEGDFLPGLILDRYGEVLVFQFLTAGMDRLKEQLVELAAHAFRPRVIYERSDSAVRAEEELPMASGLLYGADRPGPAEIADQGCRLFVDFRKGQKTGFYLDQRENRLLLEKMAAGRKVLDVFCYTGAFSMRAAIGGAAELVLVDSSEEALRMAEMHFDLNGLVHVPHRMVRGNGFETMRGLHPDYDAVVLDPPPFARKRPQVQKASRGYKDLMLQAIRLLKPGGLLFTFSCSHHISFDLFQKILFSAGLDAGRELQIVNRRGQPLDHPVNVNHPEGEYLKGFICRVL
jgi:23S rRNA (cytosine1962-C5)-methyltransferase